MLVALSVLSPPTFRRKEIGGTRVALKRGFPARDRLAGSSRHILIYSEATLQAPGARYNPIPFIKTSYHFNNCPAFPSRFEAARDFRLGKPAAPRSRVMKIYTGVERASERARLSALAVS